MSHFAPFFKLYGPICTRYEENLKVVDSLSSSNTKFAQFLNEQVTGPRCNGESLQSFLIRPVQRIPRYRLLLEQLLKYTPVGHPDREFVEVALTKVSAVAGGLNETLRRYENQAKLYDACYAFVPPRPDFVEPYRTLEQQTCMEMITSRGKAAVTLFLFNDKYVIGDALPLAMGKLHRFNAAVFFLDGESGGSVRCMRSRTRVSSVPHL